MTLVLWLGPQWWSSSHGTPKEKERQKQRQEKKQQQDAPKSDE
ncbi:MAG: hypothetical protein ACXU86_14565 [Archangium sp.]